MPTGYTSDLHNGKEVSFEDFAMNCSRAFGALIHLRDDINAEIPETLEVSESFYERVKSAEDKIAHLKNMSDAELEAQIQENYNQELASANRIIGEKLKLKKNYQLMLNRVLAWEPPTEKHIGLRTFMTEQLNSSIEADCDISYYSNLLENLEIASVDDYRAEMLKSETRHLSNARDHLEEAEKSAKDKSRWLRALRESLKVDRPSKI